MITFYIRKNTNESLGENEEKQSSENTHQKQIFKATENITGCQEDLCVLFGDFS